MRTEPNPFADADADPESEAAIQPRRLYLREPGWRIGIKRSSEREFCYMVAPGQDFYHRLYDGEIYVYSTQERLCLACAERRGLLSTQPVGLRDPIEGRDLQGLPHLSDYDVTPLDTPRSSD